MRKIRTLCGPCLLAIRTNSEQPRKASALTHGETCTDCGKNADYFISIFVDGIWKEERW